MWDWVAELHRLREEHVPVAVVTVVTTTGSAPCEAGAKMVVTFDRFFGTIGGGRLEQLAIEDARAALAAGSGRMTKYPLGAKAGQCCGGVVEAFIDVVGAGPELVLFGAGHVGQALARALVGTAFAVRVVDEREDWLAGLPAAAHRDPRPWDVVLADLRWRADATYVAIMTHRHDLDQEIVEKVIEKPAKYIGLIGSETKWRRFRERLTARGVPADKLARVKCPIGLDIGGKRPEEVAVSVAAELIKVHHSRG